MSGREPTYSAHPDRGCVYATGWLGRQSKCVECPFQTCVEDETYHKLRNEEMRKLSKEKNVFEIADLFGVSERTVKRAIKEG